MENLTDFTTIGDVDNMSMDSNDTTADGHHRKDSLAYIHFMIGTYIFISNSVVIIAVKKYDYLKTRANIYIVSLAGTDVCVGVMEWVVGLHNHSILAVWFDRTGPACVGMFSFAFFSVACSMFNMVLIALDRLLYIMKPFFYGRVVTSKKVKITIGFVWLLAGVWGSIPLYTNTYNGEVAQCTMQLAIPTWYRAYANVPLLFTGAVTTGAVYIAIALKALEHKRAIFKSIPGLARGGGDVSNLSDATKSALNTLSSNLKTLKLFCIVFGLLIVCWFPYYIIEFTSEFIHIRDSYYRASTALGFLNSGINFIVYPLYNKKFRRALKNMLCPCCKGSNNRGFSDPSFATTTVTKSSGPPKPVLGKLSPAPPKPVLGTFAPQKAVLGTFAPVPDPPKPVLGIFAPSPATPDLGTSAPVPATTDLGTSTPVPATPDLGMPAPAPATPDLGTPTPAPPEAVLGALSESALRATVTTLAALPFSGGPSVSGENNLSPPNESSVDVRAIWFSLGKESTVDMLTEKQPPVKSYPLSAAGSAVDRALKGKTASCTSHPSSTFESSSDSSG